MNCSDFSSYISPFSSYISPPTYATRTGAGTGTTITGNTTITVMTSESLNEALQRVYARSHMLAAEALNWTPTDEYGVFLGENMYVPMT